MSCSAPTIRAVLFDFDGVIIETEEPGYWVWQKIYAEHGEELTVEQFSQVIGTHFITFNPRTELENRLGKVLDWNELDQQREEYYKRVVAEQPILPGILELIQEARQGGVRTAIVSSSPRSWIDHWVGHHHLESQFDYIMCVDEVPVPKPSPDLYLAALDRLGLTADQAVAIEDSPNGSKAALRAGLFCVVVPSDITSRLKFEVDFPRLESLADINLAALEKMKSEYRAQRK
jgi:putative hydrolase of the HAD superfamily